MTNYSIYRNSIMRRYVDYGSRTHLNCIRHDPAASDKHKDKVEEVCRYLRKNNIDYICRAVIELPFPLEGTMIPDIFAFTEPKPIAIEVIDTETTEHVEEKLKKYPKEIRKAFISINDIIENIGLI